MSRSPTGKKQQDPQQAYLEGWQQLAERIQRGQSFSGRERNCAFLNTRGVRFADVSAAVGLDFLDDSRAVAISDWDHDGDLDLWVANRTGPRIRFLRNDIENENRSISFRLVGDPSQRCPSDAIGARVELIVRDADGQQSKRIQTLTAGDGFLSQSSKRLFFGIEAGCSPVQVAVRWPGSDGAEVFSDLAADQHYRLEQGTGRADQRPARVKVTEFADTRSFSTDKAAEESSGNTRVWRSRPLRVDPISYQSYSDESLSVGSLHQGPLLITLWATWCVPCLEELESLTQHAEEIRQLGGSILALNVEALQADAVEGIEQQAEQFLTDLDFPFHSGMATTALIAELDSLRKQTIYRQDPMPIPAGFLLDKNGQLRVMYTGAVPFEQLMDDLRHLDDDDQQSQDRAVPFAGRWSSPLFITNPIAIASIYREELQFSDAAEYLSRYLTNNSVPPSDDDSAEATKQRLRFASVYDQLGKLSMDQQQFGPALKFFDQALRFNKKMVSALIDRATCLQRTGDPANARRSLEEALRLRPANADAWNQLGIVHLSMKQMENAANCFERSLKNNPRAFPAANNLAWLRATAKSPNLRNGTQALSLAKSLAEGPGAKRPDVLDTLAAAYAENRLFEDAVMTAKRAIEIANDRGMTSLAQRIQTRLALYQQSEPFRDD